MKVIKKDTKEVEDMVDAVVSKKPNQIVDEVLADINDWLLTVTIRPDKYLKDRILNHLLSFGVEKYQEGFESGREYEQTNCN